MAPVIIEKKSDVQRNVGLAEKIFEDHRDFIRSVIRFNVNNEVDVEDIFQDFFLALISKPIPQEVRNMRGFLCRKCNLALGNVEDSVERLQALIEYLKVHNV